MICFVSVWKNGWLVVLSFGEFCGCCWLDLVVGYTLSKSKRAFHINGLNGDKTS